MAQAGDVARNGRYRSQTDSSSLRGPSTVPVRWPKTIVARTPGSHCGQSSPVRVGSPATGEREPRLLHLRRQLLHLVAAPVNICTAGTSTTPKTNGSSSAWHDPNTPPKAGDSHSKR